MLETERKQLLPYALIAFLFFVATLTIIFTVNPFQASGFILATFYFSLLVFLVSFLGFFLYLARLNSIQLLPYEKHRIALRESLLLAILIVGSLFLSSKQLLYWWVESAFIVAIIFIETYFLI